MFSVFVVHIAWSKLTSFDHVFCSLNLFFNLVYVWTCRQSIKEMNSLTNRLIDSFFYFEIHPDWSKQISELLQSFDLLYSWSSLLVLFLWICIKSIEIIDYEATFRSFYSLKKLFSYKNSIDEWCFRHYYPCSAFDFIG